MGMTSMALDVEAEQALAVLRGQAYALGRTVDDLAADVVDGRHDPRQAFGDDGAGPR
jgi:hypothetical protein